MKLFLLKLLPYFISLACGLALYLLAEVYIAHLGVQGLVISMASGLLSIPLIFICYEVVSRICSQNLRQTLFDHLSFEVNALVIDLLIQTRKLIGSKGPLDNDSLEALLQTEAETIEKKIVLDAAAAQEMNRVKDELLLVIQRHGHGHADLLTETEMQALLGLRKEAGTVGREVLHQLDLPQAQRDNRYLAANLRGVLEHIAAWLEECEAEALVSHHHFRFLNEK